MEFKECLEYHIDSLIDKNIDFALYRLPNGGDIGLIVGGSVAVYNDFSALNGKEGFVIAPFLISDTSPILLISPEVALKGEKAIADCLNNKEVERKEEISFRSENTVADTGELERYKEKYQLFYQALESGNIKKLVLSRTFDMPKKETFSAGMTFRRACEKYPSNFIFLCNTSQSGTWFGCSPERLVVGEKGAWKTDALAGTQEASNMGDSIVWDDKNQMEQLIVVDYMKDQLQKFGIQATCGNPKTIRSGNLVHLRSELSFRMDENSHIGDLLGLLHPSPAVCGFPKEAAFDFINRNEGYDRKYYSGFIGCLNISEKTDLFVNLRCMQIFKDKMKLYAGGGILTSSELMSEWKETGDKLQTILSVLNE